MKITSASDTVKNYTALEHQVNPSEWLLMNFGARKEPPLLDFHSLLGPLPSTQYWSHTALYGDLCGLVSLHR